MLRNEKGKESGEWVMDNDCGGARCECVAQTVISL